MAFHIALAEKNPLELEAVRTAQGNVLMAVVSQIPTQVSTPITPMGRQNLLVLAAKRAEQALKKSDKADLVLGMATGIETIDPINILGDVLYFEITAIVAAWGPENILPIISQTVRIPTEAIQHAIAQPGGLMDNPIGQSMVAMGRATDPDDPYEDEHSISRVTIIANAVEAIFNQVDFGDSIVHV